MPSSSGEGEEQAQIFHFPPMVDWAAYHSTHDEAVGDDLTRGQAWCLYLSHFLFMWNSRTYEYGAVGHRTPVQSPIC
jgi:hypothetical protein